jgi:hypothetical protein
MDRSSAVRALNPNAACPSREDVELWGRVLTHLNTDAPLPAVLARPWHWLNQRGRQPRASGASATILQFPATRLPSQTTQD